MSVLLSTAVTVLPGFEAKRASPLYVRRRTISVNQCATLESYIDAVEDEIDKFLLNPVQTRDNLNKEETSALQTLKNRHDIVIKKADRGSKVVLMDKDKYLAEAHRQLSDDSFLQKATF
jgi:hypothetical protein